ncbi:MAG: ATP-binding protein [Pseudomonadota bacterium]
MALNNLKREEFIEILHEQLSPAHPIQSFEHLYGRYDQLQQIEQALCAPGRHVFIYGDRGVGKSSLAQTAAFKHQSSDSPPIIIGCEKKSTFLGIIQAILERLFNNPSGDQITHTTKVGVSVPKLSLEHETSIKKGEIPIAKDINSATHLLNYYSLKYSKKTLVVLDEFDLIGEQSERGLFADFVKQLGDQFVTIQFIFCGIGKSLDELLVAHASSYRYMLGIEVQRLDWTARWEIIDKSSHSLGLTINDDSRFRIAAISDGYPHYIHLVCENLYWECFNDEEPIAEATPEHYIAAVRKTVKGIEHHLRRSYEQATMKSSNDYHEVLWAVADHFELIRATSSIYLSYCRIMDSKNEIPIESAKFNLKLGQLKTSSFGEILESSKRGWYEYKENIVRGYVRLRAEEQGVRLQIEHEPTPDPKRFTVGGIKSKPNPVYPRPTFGRVSR